MITISIKVGIAILCMFSQYTVMIDLSKISGFDWNEGNSLKNAKHSVSMAEFEQVFFNAPLLLLTDVKHSQ